jgi:hypothetical protein
LEEHVAYIFMVKEQAKQETSMKEVASRASSLFFDPEDGGDMFL